MAGLFENMRMKMLGVDKDQEANQEKQVYDLPVEDMEYDTAIKQIQDKQMAKGFNGNETAYSKPLLGSMSMNPEYQGRPSATGHYDLHSLLRRYTNNTILNAIINTRTNQVSLFCTPSRYSEKGVGFQIRLKDINTEPTDKEIDEMRKIEQFILEGGKEKDTTRDGLSEFVKKIVRDTLIYDQVNFEKIFDSNGNFQWFKIVDPATMYFATDEEGNKPKEGPRYVQVLNGRVVQSFSPREMAFEIRNPRSDVYSKGYGKSELETTMFELNAYENTVRFNDRFFSHGGTTRGVLQLKSSTNQSQAALDMFKREWKNTLSGINGAWQIPVVNAEDVKFVNMTPTARDMEFESWLNFLINVISSTYGIDPAEINFPNRGGATGSSGPTLNEGNAGEKMQASQNKGLLPLVNFIEGVINKHIVSEFGDKYYFQFVGGDVSTELQKIKVLAEKGKIAMTVNEVREELGLPGDVPGGDIPLNGTIVQRIGQEVQKENFEYQKQQDRLNQMIQQTTTTTLADGSSTGLSFQDIQQGLAGNSSNVDGKDTRGVVGRDGQSKEQDNANSMNQNEDKDNS